MAGKISMGARREVVSVVAERYRWVKRAEEGRILDELCATTGWHRKHAVRALRKLDAVTLDELAGPRARSPTYGATIKDALRALWEASDLIDEHLGEPRDDSAITAWLGQLTRRLCVDRLRSTAREAPAGEELEPADVDDTLENLDDALAVQDALRAVPEHCQEILDRFFCRDESYAMIGAALELPPGTIASRISRCLRRLRETFEGKKTTSPAV